MENAPLTLAYTHARNAAQETKRSNPVAASEEHDLAAAEFATAAAATTDSEALRVLKLLEAHHRQLGQILKETHLKPAGGAKVVDDHKGVAEQSHSRPGNEGTGNAQPPKLAQPGRRARDLSSSIASNLASARGIPSTRPKRTLPVSPLVSHEHADALISHDNAESRRTPTDSTAPANSRPSWAPPEAVANQSSPKVTASSSPFQNFYNRFESAISTLTAPLAFASLPLSQQNVTESAQAHPSQVPPAAATDRESTVKAKPSTTTALDFSQLISNAALRAVQDGGDRHSKPHESFFLVQPSGGTMSYADIAAASFVDKQLARGHRRNRSNASNDDFVDAPQVQKRHPTGQPEKYHGKTAEEIFLENQVLKRTLEDVTKRVHGWEMASQHSTAMLAQSVRGLGLSPVTTPENSRGKTTAVSGVPGSDLASRMQQKRIDDLESALQKYDKRLSKREEENAKLKDTLTKYREKWEGLKAGAKARREQTGDKNRRTSSTTVANAAGPSTPSKDEAGHVADT